MRSGYVSIIGRPNVGKSTLINRLVGEKIAAVSPKPQTTRNRIIGVHNTKKGQIVLLDTPGIHKPFTKMHRKMVDTAMAALTGIDVILLMVDSSKRFGGGDRFVLELFREIKTPTVLALNKTDKISKSRLLPLIDTYSNKKDFFSIVPISALRGDGIDELEDELLAALPKGNPVFPKDYLTDQPEQTLAAEIIREKLFLHTRREVPYSCAVLIEEFEETPRRLEISATIVVDRSTQKGIVIGKAGQMLKKIGTEARLELQKILNTKIHLSLFVKVSEHWRESDHLLRELGIK